MEGWLQEGVDLVGTGGSGPLLQEVQAHLSAESGCSATPPAT